MNALVAQQDYFWFLATVAWLGLIALAMLARNENATRVPAWLIVVACAAVAHALASIFLMMARRDIYTIARWQDDVLLALPLATCAGALGWAASRSGFRWMVAFSLGGALALRPWAPEWSSHVISLVASAAAWVIAARSEGVAAILRPLQRVAVLLLVGMILLSPAGSVAGWIGETQRWNRLPQIGLPCAIVCLAAGMTWLWICIRLTEKHWGLGQSLETERRDLRRLGMLMLAWLLVGFVLTEWSGRFARQTFEQSLLAQARVGAAVLRNKPLRALLGPQLKLSNPVVVTDASTGSTDSYAVSEQLTSENLADLRATLSMIRKAVPHALWVQLMTVRGNHLVSIAFDERVPVNSGEVPIQREITARDREDWSGREPFVTGPISLWGMHVSGRAPVFDAQGGMLGWLAVDVPVDLWVAAQTQARAQSLLLTGAGVALGLLVFGLRLRSRERQAAQRVALEAQQAEQRQTVFLAKVSHELRTPIQNILGYAHLLQVGAGAGEQEKLEAIRSQSSLLIRLVNDLIDLSAAQAGEFRLRLRPTPLGPLIAEEVAAHRARAQAKGLALHVEFSRPELGVVECDPDRIRQVITNLVGNAIKFTPTGWVRVAVKTVPGSSGTPSCEILVADSGPGIVAEDQRRLFLPFERLAAGHTTGEGSGLGLALCRRICQAMGGSLEVESDGATGSTFRARFPAPPASAETAALVTELFAPAAPSGVRVLIAEDNALVRRLFRAWLEAGAGIVTEAVDGLDAYQQVIVDKPEVLVVDISMPGLDGIALTRKLREEGHLSDRLKIVGVSAHARAADRAAALAAGMNALLLKPVEPAALVAAVLGAGVHATPAATQLQQHLRREFAGMGPRLMQRVDEAYGGGDWARLAALSHELGNCAFALQHCELGETSALLEQILRMQEIPSEGLLRRLQAAVSSACQLSPLHSEVENPPTNQPIPPHESVPGLRRASIPPPGRN